MVRRTDWHFARRPRSAAVGHRLGDVFGAILAALEQHFHGNEASCSRRIVGAADCNADGIGPIRRNAERFTQIIPGNKFLLHRIPLDREYPHGSGWCLTFRHDVRPQGLSNFPERHLLAELEQFTTKTYKVS